MTRKILILTIWLLLSQCDSKDCIDENLISYGPCTFDYRPVCGCDNQTYSNACFANRAGVTSYRNGECRR
jgi:hypothetical protein